MRLNNSVVRFVYLNTYALLLSVIGVGISVIPLYKVSWFFLIIQIPIAFFTLRGAYVIFSSWERKKRSYKILIEKNSRQFSPESFHEYMEAPCGRLLTKVVLSDLSMEENYAMLKKQYQMTFFNDLKQCRYKPEVVVHFNEDFQFAK